MIKKYGASKDHTYKFHTLVVEENEKRKDNNDSDKLIDDNSIKPK